MRRTDNLRPTIILILSRLSSANKSFQHIAQEQEEGKKEKNKQMSAKLRNVHHVTAAVNTFIA